MKLLALSVLSLFMLCSIALSAERTCLINKPFVVEPGADVAYEVGNTQYKTRLTGHFRARGGRGNDIMVSILEAEAYENVSNGHGCPPESILYGSGKVTVGHFDVVAPPGKYILSFSNRFSSVSNKVVEAEVYQEVIYR
jgi:hypothetical protein